MNSARLTLLWVPVLLTAAAAGCTFPGELDGPLVRGSGEGANPMAEPGAEPGVEHGAEPTMQWAQASAVGADAGIGVEPDSGTVAPPAPDPAPEPDAGAPPPPEPDAGAPPPPPPSVSYSNDVQPILDSACLRCHTVGKAAGQYRVDDYAATIKPGVTGQQPVVPGNPSASLIWSIEDGATGSCPLCWHNYFTAAQRNTVAQWITQGAKND